MKQWLLTSILFGFGFLLFFPVSYTFAQFNMGFEQASVQLILDPQLPEPYESVKINLDDYALGIFGSRIEWSIDGEVQPEVANERNLTVTAPNVGETKTISVRVQTPTGEVLTTSHTIRPFYTDIIIEPYTFAPALYKGRPLPSFGSQVLITALIHDESGIISPTSLTYVWEMEGRVLNNGPVRGGFQNTIVVPFGRNILLGLTVANSQGQTISRRLITFPSVPVDLQFYEVNPLFGLSHIVASNPLFMIGNSTTIRAVPYNLDVFANSTQLFTEWRIDNVRQSINARDPFEISVVNNGFGGSTRVNFKLRHLEALVQGGERNLTIQH